MQPWSFLFKHYDLSIRFSPGGGGGTGDSNALSIAKSIGFDRNVIERAQKHWVEKLVPEKQQERSDMCCINHCWRKEKEKEWKLRPGKLHLFIERLWSFTMR